MGLQAKVRCCGLTSLVHSCDDKRQIGTGSSVDLDVVNSRQAELLFIDAIHIGDNKRL